MNRREFLACLPFIIESTSALWGVRCEKGFSSVSEAERRMIEAYASGIVRNIVSVNETYGNNTQEDAKFSWNIKVVSETFCALAYLDGGFEEVKRVCDFVKERGMSLNITTHDSGILGTHRSSMKTDEKIALTVDEVLISKYLGGDVQWADCVIRHELYHAVQEANNPDLFHSIIGFRVGLTLFTGVAVGATSGIGSYNLIRNETRYFDWKRNGVERERLVLAGLVGGLVGLITTPLGMVFAKFLSTTFNPVETGDYVKTGVINDDPRFIVDGLLTSNPLIQLQNGLYLTRVD